MRESFLQARYCESELCHASGADYDFAVGERWLMIPSAVHLASMIYASVIVHRQRQIKNSPFASNRMYSQRVPKDGVFGDQVELVREADIERPNSVLESRLDQRYQEHV